MDYAGIAKWALTGHTGSSSKCMAAYLCGFWEADRQRNHPHDGGDFERCLGLLRAVPSLRDELPNMAGASPYWKALVERWQEIENCPADARYKLMREILDPIEDADPRVMRFGNGASISF